MILDTIERMKAEQPSPYGFKGTDQTIKKYIQIKFPEIGSFTKQLYLKNLDNMIENH